MNETKVKICCLCKGEIDKQYTPQGVMFWDGGHNAQPLKDGQCCSTCNDLEVIPRRLTLMKMGGVGK